MNRPPRGGRCRQPSPRGRQQQGGQTIRQLTIYWTTDDEARLEVKADGRVWRLSVPEAPAEQGYDLALNGKSLWLTDGREVFWNCGPFWTEPNYAEVMMALGLHEADVAEYRRWHAGGLLHATGPRCARVGA